MKRVIVSAVMLLAVMTASAQSPPNARKTSNGNYVSISKTTVAPKATGKTYTDSKGVVYPVWETISKDGSRKLFINKRSGKTGKEYRYYLKLEQ